MTRKINHAALSALIRRDAERYGKANRTDDAEVRAVIARDILAMHAIADFVAAKNMRRAYQRLMRCDTALRDGFSRKAYDGITGGCAPGHSEFDS